MLKVLPNELQFGAVAVNDAPVYSRFSVSNTDPNVSLSVQLTATTKQATIRFKLYDSMAIIDTADDMDNGRPLKDVQEESLFFHHYNAMFDDSYIVDRFVLQPLESKTVVAIFYADPAQFPGVIMQAPPVMVSGMIHVTAATLPRETICVLGETCNSKSRSNVDFSNMLFFSNGIERDCGEYLSNNQICGGEGMIDEVCTNCNISVGGTSRGKNLLSSLSYPVIRSPLYTMRSETATLPFSAGVYLSWLTVSKSELQTTMAPNKTHLMDFTVTNTSSLPLLFVIRMQTIPHKNIEFSIYEEDKFDQPKLGRTLMLDSYASMNLTLMVRAANTALDDGTTDMLYYRAVLQCDNLRDSRNVELVYVSVNVVASESQKDLVSIDNSVLDFGEVYRGTQVLKKLNFSTTTREDITIRLVDSRPQHCEGALSLVRESNNTSSEDNSITTSNNVGMLHVDELVIAPPKGIVTVGVVYVPSTDKGRKGISNLKFDLKLVVTGCSSDSGDSRRQQQVVVRCVATLFTSTIVASHNNINFGDCQVGQSKRWTFEIENQSPLPTTIYVQLRSKIVSIEGIQPRTSATGGRETLGEFSIAPRSSLPLTLRITPQRVNPTYQKQLIIDNVSNPAEDRLIVNIEANNMAPSEAELHNELYTCELKFDCDDGNGNCSTDDRRATHDGAYASSLRALTNVPLIVAYVLRSKVEYPLMLQLQCSSTEVETFCLEGTSSLQFEQLAMELRKYCYFGGGCGCEDVAQKLSIERAEEVRNSVTKTLYQHAIAINSVNLEPHGSRTFYVNICRTIGSCDVLTKEDGVSIALDGIEIPRFIRLSYRICATRFELGGQKTKNFGEVNIGERKTTKLPIVNRCNSLLLLKLSKSRSVAAGYIRMENSERNSVYCLIRPYATKELELFFYPGIKGNFEERIQVTNVLDPQNEVIMTLKATITKANTFDISPDSWSFGVVYVPRLARQPLRQSLQGSGSCSSSVAVGRADDEKLARSVRARFTVVNTSTTRRALRLKLVSPSAVGTFCGRNFADNGGANVINSCGVSNGGGMNSDGTPNTADRFFKFDGVEVRLQLEMEHGGISSGCSRSVEEKIEILEQKLKIYRRKNKNEKVEHTMRHIDALRLALRGEKVSLSRASSPKLNDGDRFDCGNCEQKKEGEQQLRRYNEFLGRENQQTLMKPKSHLLQHPELLSFLLRDGVELPEMNAGESTIIKLVLSCTRTTECIPLAQSGSITFLLFETNDNEANRVIPVDVTLVRVEGEDDSLPISDAVGTTAPSTNTSFAKTKKPQMTSLTALPVEEHLAAAPSYSGERKLLVKCGSDKTTMSASFSTNHISMVSTPPLPSFVISVGSGDNVIATTFMNCPMAFVPHCIAYEPCRLSMFVRATRDVSVAVLNPVSCFGNMNKGVSSTSGFIDSSVDCFGEYNNYFAHVDSTSLVPSTSLISDTLANSLDAHFNFAPRNGLVRRNESLCITVECTPMSLVPHRYFIPVRDLQNASNVTYLVLGLNPKIEEDSLHVSPKEIQLSDILMPCDKQRLEVRSFVVHSSLKMPHALVVRSNRPSLVSFFMDAECTLPLVNPVKNIFTDKKVSVYVRFVPTGRSWRHKSRVMVAGIFVEAVSVNMHAEQVNCNVLAQTFVRLTACVGSGELLVRESFIDLGAVSPQCSFVSAIVTVINPSDRFKVCARMEGTSALTVVDTPELTLPPKGEVCVQVKLQLASSGLVRESLSVCNLSCNQEPLTVGLSVLRHDEAISARVVYEDEELLRNHYCDKKKDLQQQEQCMDSGSCNIRAILAQHSDSFGGSDGWSSGVVVFPIAAVVLGEDGTFSLQSSITSTAMHVTNHSTRDFILVAKSSAPLVLGSPNLSPFVDDALVSSSSLPLHAYPRGRVRLDAHNTQVLTWTLVSMPSLSAEQTSQLMQQKVLTIEAVAQVCIAQVIDETIGFNYGALLFSTKRTLPAVGQCVLLLKFFFTFAISEGCAKPPLIDLGVVGNVKGGVSSETNAFTGNEENHGILAQSSSFAQRHTAPAISRSRWIGCCARSNVTDSSTPLVIHLTNLSPVLPLRLSVECEPTVRFTSNRIVVPPSQTIAVEAFLVPKLIRTQGPFCFAVYFVNELNPENDMLVHVKGQYYWKVFELLCDGVMDGGRESFSMGALRVTKTSAAGDILSESKILMTAIEPQVEVEVFVKENPKLEGIIQLQALQYDAARSLERIVFGQSKHSSINVATVPAVANSVSNKNSGFNNINICVGSATDSVSNSGGVAPASFAVSGTINNGTSVGGNNFGCMSVTSLAANTSSAPVSSLTASDSLVMPAALRQKEQHSFRLRCVLIKEDFAALSAAFYGQRKKKTIKDTVRERETVTFDKIAELVERRRGTGSSPMWLGTLRFSNTLTEGEDEVQVFSTLDAFQTFSVSTHLTLTPCTNSEIHETIYSATNFSPKARTTGGRVCVEAGGMNCGICNVYVGELVVVNPCLQHHVALSVTPLKDYAYQDVVSVVCIPVDGEAPLSPTTNKYGFSDALHDTTIAQKNELMGTGSALPVTADITTTTSIIRTKTTKEGSDAGEGTTVFCLISPQSSRRIRVVINVDLDKHQLNIEQAVVLALFDESVPSSAVVVRIGFDSLDEALQQQQKERQFFCNSRTPRAEVARNSNVNCIGAFGGAGCGGGSDDVRVNKLFVEHGVGGHNADIATPTAGTTSDLSTSQMTGLGLAEPGNKYALSFSVPQRVLSLHGNCRVVDGCSGAYACSFSYTKDAPPATNITICNNLDDVVVEYSVVIVSQGPQPWLLLPSATAVLDPGERQPLRLDILSTEAGSFNGYVSIFNNAVPGEVLLLQLSAEVFVPTAGENLFEIVASNGQRVSTNTERTVFVGRLFGEGTQRTYMALEIVSRAAVSLEFSVAVVRPFRMEFVNIPDDESEIANATNITANTIAETTVTSNISNSCAHGASCEMAASESTGGLGDDDEDNKERQKRYGGGGFCPKCDVRLLVCHMNEALDAYDQKRLVIAPKSRVKVAFVLFCDRVSLPDGFVAHGEAEVVLKCRQARNAKFIFNALFDIYSPSMRVPRQVIFTPGDDYIKGISVTNLRSRELRITFRTFLPVIDILPLEETKEEDIGSGCRDQLQQQPQQKNDINIIIRGGGTVTIPVRLNVARLTALLGSWSSNGDVTKALFTFCVHGLLLDVDNPSERVFVEFCYLPQGASATSDRSSVAALAAAHSITKSLTFGYQQISEQRMFQFVQNFWRILHEASDVILPEFRYYTEQQEIGAPGTTGESAGGVSTSGNSGSGGGVYNSNKNLNICATNSNKNLNIYATNNNNTNRNNNNNSSWYSTNNSNIIKSQYTSIGASCWMSLHSLLVDLTCLVEELLYESVLLAKSWAVESRAFFLAVSVTSHPLIRAWRQHRQILPTTCMFAVFGQYLETIDALPCLTPFLD